MKCMKCVLPIQDAAIAEHTERLAAAAQAARQLVRKQDTVLKERVEQACVTFQPSTRPHPLLLACCALP
jgi:hypothetical protein